MGKTSDEKKNDELSKLEVMKLLGDESISQLAQALRVLGPHFQQSLNCCGFTSLAFALTAMGFPTTVDDLFWTVGVPVESVVGDGMTLAEVYDALQRYIARKRLPLRAECTHFDSFAVTADQFRDAAEQDAAAGMADLYVLNFHSGIAHDWPAGQGGGHFSVLVGLDRDSDQVVVADVHGAKYGTYWAAPVDRLYAAMADHDSCGRARGAIRFVRAPTGAACARSPFAVPPAVLPASLVDWNSPPEPFRAAHTAAYVPRIWDAGLGTKNMEGASAASAAVRVLYGDRVAQSTLDGLMRTLHVSYTRSLDTFLPAAEVADMLKRAQDDLTGVADPAGAEGSVRRVELGPKPDGKAVRKALADARCGADNVVVLAAFDVNEVVGQELLPPVTGEAAALSHGPNTWALLAAADGNAETGHGKGVLVAPAHNVIMTGRMWACSMDGLAKGMTAISELTPPELVVMTR